MSAPARRILGVVGGVGAVATGAAATVLTLASRQDRRAVDRHAGEPLGRLEPDFTCTVAADDGVSLHVEEIRPADGGTPDVTLIGVHGLAVSSASWHFQRRDLAALTLPRVRQVYYDQRGHGQSGPVSSETATAEQLATDLHAVLRALAPGGNVVLIGHSLGGLAIMALAEQEPELFAERVSGVALISTSTDATASGLLRSVRSKLSPVGWGVGGIGGLAEWQPEIVELLRAAGVQLTRPAVRRLLFGESASSTVVEFVLGQLDGMGVKDALTFVGAISPRENFAGLDELKHTSVQVMAGAADRVVPFSHSERIAAALPQAQLVRLEGVGHLPHLEQPEVVTSQLIDLVQRCCDVESGGVRDAAFRKLLRRWFP